MRSLGLIGGTSWHSTIEYYRHINQYVNDFFGDNTNPPLLVFTINQSLIHKFQRENNWDEIANLITQGARSLEKAGAEMLMLCANTPHKVFHKIENQIDTKILHIADATRQAIEFEKLKKVCFLGTKFTMEESFITQRIEQNGIKVITPESKIIIKELHRIIQEELTYGNIIKKSKDYVLSVVESLVEIGAEGIILGCTEFPLMIKESEIQTPIFNTTQIHAIAGAKFILKDLSND